MTPFSKSKKRGCPTCDGVDPKSCLRCKGKTRRESFKDRLGKIDSVLVSEE